MNTLIQSPSWIFTALIVVIPSILLCTLLLWIIRRYIPAETLQKNHDVAGFSLSIIGVLYSVILGFTVVNVQTRYNDAEKNIHQEATTLADIYRNAGFFPEKSRVAIRNELRSYLDYVITEEWGSEKRNLHLVAQNILHKLWKSYEDVDLSDPKAAIWYTESISAIDRLMDIRLEREFSSWEHLGGMMWTLLILGGFITICFMYFFGLENFRSQLLMTVLITGYVSFILFLIYSLDHIFQGPQALQPVALEQIREFFNKWE